MLNMLSQGALFIPCLVASPQVGGARLVLETDVEKQGQGLVPAARSLCSVACHGSDI